MINAKFIIIAYFIINAYILYYKCLLYYKYLVLTLWLMLRYFMIDRYRCLLLFYDTKCLLYDKSLVLYFKYNFHVTVTLSNRCPIKKKKSQNKNRQVSSVFPKDVLNVITENWWKLYDIGVITLHHQCTK